MLSLIRFFLFKAHEQNFFLNINQYHWEGDISKLAGGHQNKQFDIFKTSPFPANLDFELYVVSPDQADNQKRFLTNLFRREILKSFLKVITTNRFEFFYQVHSVCSNYWLDVVSHAKQMNKTLFELICLIGQRFQGFLHSKGFLPNHLTLQK